MQSYSKSTPTVGFQHTYINQGTLKSLSHIYKSEGIRGLWRGVDAAMARTSVGSAVQLSTYDQTKRFLISTGFYQPQDLSLHFSASMMTSFFVCLAMNPFDVASTRMVIGFTDYFYFVWIERWTDPNTLYVIYC